MIDTVVGGDAKTNAEGHTDWEPPKGGLGGMVGGVCAGATFRVCPTEDNPNVASQNGMDFGASFVPVADPLARLITGTTVSGRNTSRAWAAVDLAVDSLTFFVPEEKFVCVAGEEDRTWLAFRSTAGEIQNASKAKYGIPDHMVAINRSSSELLKSDRAIARETAIQDALNSLRSGNPTPQAQYLADRLENLGREHLLRFLETGELPKNFEFSHLYSAAEYPEFARRGDLGVVTDSPDHRLVHHGGNTRVPLHGAPRGWTPSPAEQEEIEEVLRAFAFVASGGLVK
jgi:hypothetical protein